MEIVRNDAKKLSETGVVAYVYPFDGLKGYSIVARKGFVEIDGTAIFTPEHARTFAEGIKEAADIAQEAISQTV